jgi:hypothetical protein
MLRIGALGTHRALGLAETKGAFLLLLLLDSTNEVEGIT